MILTVICEGCREEIGKIDTETISYPWKAEDFMSVDAEHQAKPPFLPGTEWEFVRCPMGPHRPFHLQNRIQTSQGYFYLDSKIFKAVTREDRAKIQDVIDLETRERMMEMAAMSVDELRAMRRTQQPEDVSRPPINPPSSEPSHPEGPGFLASPLPAPHLKSWVCSKCGKELKSKAGLVRHEHFCTKEVTTNG